MVEIFRFCACAIAGALRDLKMGWVWRDDDDDQQISSRDISEFGRSDPHSQDRCSTRRVVKSQCRTEEVDPGKFVRKCEKTEEILRDCIGK